MGHVALMLSSKKKATEAVAFGHQPASWTPQQGVCSQTEDQPERWRPHNRTAERPQASQLETRRLDTTLSGLMAFVFFEVLYNDEGGEYIKTTARRGQSY